jgi:hypothetical protein
MKNEGAINLGFTDVFAVSKRDYGVIGENGKCSRFVENSS